MVSGIASALTVYNGGVAALPVFIKAEGVKLFHHLPLHDTVIKTAVGVGAGVFRVFLCKCSEALFGGVAVLPLLQNLFSLRLSSFFCFIGVGSVFRCLCLNQDMANCHGGILLFNLIQRDFAGFLFQNLVVDFAGKLHLSGILLYAFHIVASAVIGGNKLVGTAVAIFLCRLFQRGKAVFHSLLFFISQGDAVFGGIFAQSLVLLQSRQRLIQEVVSPGSAVTHGALLVCKAGKAVAGVQSEKAGIAAVVVHKSLILVSIGISHLCRAVVPAVDGNCSCLCVEEGGVQDKHQNNENRNADQGPGPSSVVDCLFPCLFLCGNGLLVRAGFTCCLADLLFC